MQAPATIDAHADAESWASTAAERLRAAAVLHEPVQLEGAATRRPMLAPADGASLSAVPCRGIVAYHPGDMVVTVRSGTPLEELEAVLAAQGQMLPFEPPRRPGSTIGGVVALGWSGPRRPFAGSARDHVTGVRLIDGCGRDLRFGGPVVKNVAGFDVPRLATGSRGALGLLLEVSLRLCPRPAVERSCAFVCSANEALQHMRALPVGPGVLSGACWIEGLLLLLQRLRGQRAGPAAALALAGHTAGAA